MSHTRQSRRDKSASENDEKSKNKSEQTLLNDSVQELIRRMDKFDTCQQQTNKSVEEIIRSLDCGLPKGVSNL